MWKQRSGSKATYSRLIKIFERAGYQDCADKVRSTAQLSDSETDDSSGSGEEQSQPKAYPSHNQRQILSVSSPAVSKSTETFVIVDKDNLPEGKTDYENHVPTLKPTETYMVVKESLTTGSTQLLGWI